MTEETEIPVWARREFCKRSGVDYELYRDGHYSDTVNLVIRAGAALIAKHEPELAPAPEPRPDPLAEVVKAYFGEMGWPMGSGVKRLTQHLRTAGVTIKVPWDGGDCPLEPGTDCVVWFRDGQVGHYPCPEQSHLWNHTGRLLDIIAYMVLPS